MANFITITDQDVFDGAIRYATFRWKHYGMSKSEWAITILTYPVGLLFAILIILAIRLFGNARFKYYDKS